MKRAASRPPPSVSASFPFLFSAGRLRPPFPRAKGKAVSGRSRSRALSTDFAALAHHPLVQPPELAPGNGGRVSMSGHHAARAARRRLVHGARSRIANLLPRLPRETFRDVPPRLGTVAFTCSGTQNRSRGSPYRARPLDLVPSLRSGSRSASRLTRLLRETWLRCE
jgi:hypothetical protein